MSQPSKVHRLRAPFRWDEVEGEIRDSANFTVHVQQLIEFANINASARAEELPKTQHRYSAPFKMYGKTTEWVQTRFVPREHIHDKPTEANPSPIRVILLGDLERAQPDAMAFNDSLGGPAPR